MRLDGQSTLHCSPNLLWEPSKPSSLELTQRTVWSSPRCLSNPKGVTNCTASILAVGIATCLSLGGDSLTFPNPCGPTNFTLVTGPECPWGLDHNRSRQGIWCTRYFLFTGHSPMSSASCIGILLYRSKVSTGQTMTENKKADIAPR